MATKADFSEDEWKAMQKGVIGAGLLVSVSDRDFTDSFGEASALAKDLAQKREDNTSELIRELAHTKGPGFGMTDSSQEVETETLDALRSSVATLGGEGRRRGAPVPRARPRNGGVRCRGEGRRDRGRVGDDREARGGARRLVTHTPQRGMIRRCTGRARGERADVRASPGIPVATHASMTDLPTSARGTCKVLEVARGVLR